MSVEEWTALIGIGIASLGGVAGWLRVSIARLRDEWEKDMDRCGRFCQAVYAPKADLVRLEERIAGIEDQIGMLRDDTKAIIQLLQRHEG